MIDLVEIRLLHSEATLLSAMGHWQSQGDFGPTKDRQRIRLGQKGKRFEAILLTLEGPGNQHFLLKYAAHVQSRGDTPYSAAGTWVGIRGQATRLESLSIRLDRK